MEENKVMETVANEVVENAAEVVVPDATDVAVSQYAAAYNEAPENGALGIGKVIVGVSVAAAVAYGTYKIGKKIVEKVKDKRRERKYATLKAADSETPEEVDDEAFEDEELDYKDEVLNKEID